MTPKLERLKADRDMAQEDFITELANVQAKCKHPQIGEVDYQPSDYGSASPPKRICMKCGLAEEGWGPGYKVLDAEDDEVFHISDSKFWKIKPYEGAWIRDDDKGPLIRGEKTVRQIIKEQVIKENS